MVKRPGAEHRKGLVLIRGLLTPDIPQSEIAATNFYDGPKFWAKSRAKNGVKFWRTFSGHLRASCAVQNDPPKCLPKFLPIYHHVLSRLLWLKSQNYISAISSGPKVAFRNFISWFPWFIHRCRPAHALWGIGL